MLYCIIEDSGWVLRIFAGKNLYWHFLAIFLTYIAVVSNLDWNYYLTFGHSSVRNFLFGGVVIGGLLPILLPIILYFFGKLKNKKSAAKTASDFPRLLID